MLLNRIVYKRDDLPQILKKGIQIKGELHAGF